MSVNIWNGTELIPIASNCGGGHKGNRGKAFTFGIPD